MRKEIVDDLWDKGAESTRDNYSFSYSTKASREVRKRIVLKLCVDRAKTEDEHLN